MTAPRGDGAKVAEAIDRNFTSPNVSDSNWEAANVVDAIAMVAYAIRAQTKAYEERTELLRQQDKTAAAWLADGDQP